MSGYLVLEDGKVFQGTWLVGKPQAGEVVFNTSHSGYEEMATDPSYFSQILIATAPQQGNYGADSSFWESKHYHIRGFICLEMQSTDRDSAWLTSLSEKGIPVITELDTREIVLYLRDQGTLWGACIQAESKEDAMKIAAPLIQEAKAQPKDWCYITSTKQIEDHKGENSKGPKIALLDFGCKKNIQRESLKRCSELRVFPSRSSAEEILSWNPDAVFLSNGPGDPNDVEGAVDNIKQILGKKPIFGICMGHQLLSKALGAKVFKLKFGHRGSNHPIKDLRTNKIYMTSQNHGYAVDAQDLPDSIQVTHTNLNDDTVAGIEDLNQRASSVQFHPESHPGPHEAEDLFDRFFSELK